MLAAGVQSGLQGPSAGAQLNGVQLVFGLHATFGVHPVGGQSPASSFTDVTKIISVLYSEDIFQPLYIQCQEFLIIDNLLFKLVILIFEFLY
ncbi:hypothetical protein A2366_04660 [Candidatus Woesebacteria bacterium RIFOXYB1_FULL_33_9]|nr:MAG: hypothetical protein A2366_04660 [Candidatus Woesebacteria bacterium RIFOXYB1_FULL_33_9]